MSEEAANAFLKLLEEPGSRTLIILITSSRDLLLPTIVSRVQSILFSTVAENDMRAMLRALRPAAHEGDEELLALAGGRPGILVQLCNDASYAGEERSLFRNIQKVMGSRDIISALRISEQAANDPARREKVISYIFMNLRHALIRPQVNNSSFHVTRVLTHVDRIARAIDSTNVNPRLGLDVMFFECMKLPLNI
jgi:DNA polymerase-3 subunit delta'